jgi:hypothetical protein
VAREGFVRFVMGVRAASGKLRRVPANRLVEVRSELLSHLRRRIAAGERLVIRTLAVQAPDQGRAGIALVLRRRARDIDRARWTRMPVKSEWSCRERRLTGFVGHSLLARR